MLAYYVEWHMRNALAPMLFDDETPEMGEMQRDSIVAPAQRSPSAIAKATTKKTTDGSPVHSFRTLLQDLATIASNQLRVRNAKEECFTMVTTPTPIQHRAFELLGVPFRL